MPSQYVRLGRIVDLCVRFLTDRWVRSEASVSLFWRYAYNLGWIHISDEDWRNLNIFYTILPVNWSASTAMMDLGITAWRYLDFLTTLGSSRPDISSMRLY